MGRRRNKYNNKQTTVCGITFQSEHEAKRYLFLRSEQDAGRISDLKTQVPYEVVPGFVYRGQKIRAIKYILDFEYIKDGRLIVEDAKGYQTDVNKIKVKLFKREYPYPEFTFRLVKSATDKV